MTRGSRDARRIERGDWQTPIELARAIVRSLAESREEAPRAIVEPTCGEGAFLLAAREAFPRAKLVGFDLNEAYVERTRRALPRADVRVADFFRTDWPSVLAELPRPLLVVGNPPWVTSAALGVVGGTNAPAKTNWKHARGLDALTGASNFDVSEWMLRALLGALDRPGDALAMLCKSVVARRVIESLEGFEGRLVRIDASASFGAQVDAALFVAVRGADASSRAPWPVFSSLSARDPSSSLVVRDGALLADADAHARTKHLEGAADPPWRSGIKHDASRVMELAREGGSLVNGFGDRVDVEDDVLFPLLKCTDLARGTSSPSRVVVVPQRVLGEDTSQLRERAPRAWAYLEANARHLDARKSRIYAGRPRFSIFGVGPYTFAPWKVAISGLHKTPRFVLVGPHEGRPVVVDDTCYVAAFDDRESARLAHAALSSEPALDFLRARVFRDDKRPITKRVLSALDWRRLV